MASNFDFITTKRINRSVKAHTCFTCKEEIPIGSRYGIVTGRYFGEILTIRHCLPKCEITPEIIDQNEHLIFEHITA